MNETRIKERSPSEILKRGYTDDEIRNFYRLGLQYLEHGDIRAAETIFGGVVEIAPDYAPGWLGMSYVHIQRKRIDEAVYAARQAVRVRPELTEGMLYLISCLLMNKDYNSAGTYLGEVGERLDMSGSERPEVARFYRSQLVRYQVETGTNR